MTSLVTRPSYIRQRLAEADIQPSKSLGQNFLADGNILDIILDAADLQPSDHVLEIGPGLGALTVPLLRRVDRVTCIEKDKRLAQLLKQDYATRAGFELIADDALDVDLDAIVADGATKVVSNLPYSVGTRIAMQLLQNPHRPERMVFLLQKDVAEKFEAGSGTKVYGLTAVWSQVEYEVEVIHVVSPSCFVPPPRIASAVLRMIRRPIPLVEIRDRAGFEDLTRFAFEHRRKQMGNILHHYAGAPEDRDEAHRVLESMGLHDQLRPENLEPAQWAELANRLAERKERAA